MPEWWVYADVARYKLVAICQGPDAEANARLIGAAPALLEALADMMEPLGPACEPVKARARAALAKAKGAQP